LTPFRAAADLLYAGPWVAERLAAIESFFAEHAEEIDPVVRGIISGGTKYSAVDCFNAQYRLSELRRETSDILKTVDFLLLPTSPTTYKIAEVDADPIRLNSNLGYYTNFVNLLDLAAVALPAGFRPNGLPFGVSLIGPKFSDTALLYSADQLHGLLMNSVASLAAPSTPPGFTLITVVGAHLAGQPLNYQLTSRGACLLKTTRTAACYRLYALDGSVPPKPGLIRDPGFHGGGIEVEVWAIPMTRFGSFVSLVVAPLGIGSLELMDGTWVQGFICEPYAAQNAREITQLGGWRAYLNSSSRTD
jgi:allophanate hydrolase